MNNKIGIVIIGRNEGERLRQCLKSVIGQSPNIIYVDSGSTDDSVKLALSMGIEVQRLDMSTPFSAGRARNTGFHYIVNCNADIEYVQFVDGDCLLSEGWIGVAVKELEEHPQWAVVAGLVRERFPEKSIYNQLCDIEWKTPIGETTACGGIFMVKREKFQAIKGFQPNVVAGEEPELCYRLREKGWKIFHLTNMMAIHDANITKFSQWWKRAVRSGHAYAQGFALYGTGRERYCFKDTLRIWMWAFLFPGLTLLLSTALSPLFFILFTAYIAQFIRIFKGMNEHLKDWKQSFFYSLFNIIGKWPQFYGQLLFIAKKVLKTAPEIIEYKEHD